MKCKIKNKRLRITIKMLKEFSLNYRFQYPTEIPNINFIFKLIIQEIKNVK
jgi:hypothetical protein